jgi:hypothetical protein
VLVASAITMLASYAGVAVAHEESADPGHESAHATAEELGESVEQEWAVSGPAGESYTIQEVVMPDMWTRVGHNLLTADGERLYGVWNEPACIGREPGSFRLTEVPDGYEIVGSTQAGASAVELSFDDGSIVTVETFGAPDVPLPFFRATVASRPVTASAVGVMDAPPCAENQVGAQ